MRWITVHKLLFLFGSTSQNVRIRDLAEMLREISGCEIEMSDDAPADRRSYRVDFAKIESTLPEFRCKWTPRAGAEELASAFAAEGLTLAEFLDAGRYSRLDELSKLIAEGLLDDDLRWRVESPVP